MHKALLIDPVRRKIVAIEVNGFESINKAIGSQIFTTAHQYENGDTIYVDDEGLFNEEARQFGFSVKGNPSEYFAGKGVITGANNDTGETIDVQSDLLDIADSITFLQGDIFAK